MEFQPIVSTPFVWIFGIGIIGFLLIQLFQIQRADISPKRKRIKQLLNALLFLGLITFIMNPVWTEEQISKPIILVSDEVGKDEIDFWRDSLKIEIADQSEDFQYNTDSIILLGENFSKEFLYSLRAKSMDWIIPNPTNKPEYLDWKGILYLGEVQKIRISRTLLSGSTLSIFQEGNELEKIAIDSDRSSIEIELPVSILARNEWEMRLNDDPIGVIRFFVLPAEPLIYQIQVGFPGPEIRALSRFLVGKGAKVQEEIQLSKNTELLTKNQSMDSVDIFIIDPSQLPDSKIQKQVARGASLLLINLNEAVSESKALNKAFGTDFELITSTSEENRILDDDLEALPEEFKTRTTQSSLFENSLAIQQNGDSKIGLSLLASTFNIAQAGDSMAYAKIWDRIEGELRPENLTSLSAKMPVFQNQFYSVEINGKDDFQFMDNNSDSLLASQSMINSNSRVFEDFAKNPGWQRLGENTEIYVYASTDWPMVFANQERANFLQSQVWLSSNSKLNAIKKPIPFWIWGLVLVSFFGVLWLEPKIED